MNIITVSREFGSGGRELGKRLADQLGFAYYDKEIISAVAQQSNMDEEYVKRALAKNPRLNVPITYGRTLALPFHQQQTTTKLLLLQRQIIMELAAMGDCVIVGRSADTILASHSPLNLFVYAEPAAKLERCRAKAQSEERLTEKELRSKIQQVDRQRKQYYELCSGRKWGAKENYHLCINTTDQVIKEITPALAELAKARFRKGKQ